MRKIFLDGLRVGPFDAFRTGDDGSIEPLPRYESLPEGDDDMAGRRRTEREKEKEKEKGKERKRRVTSLRLLE
jgi:hypothetical protein